MMVYWEISFQSMVVWSKSHNVLHWLCDLFIVFLIRRTEGVPFCYYLLLILLWNLCINLYCFLNHNIVAFMGELSLANPLDMVILVFDGEIDAWWVLCT
jgi:hypothetical protein